MPDTGWPPLPGTYVLVLYVDRERVLRIGALGSRAIPPGHYAYVGSARGPGGLRARLARHLRPTRRTHWHIDYLADQAETVMILAGADHTSRECDWVRSLLALPGAAVPVGGFGSSDCRQGCAAHLVRLPDGYTVGAVEERLQP